MPGLEEILGVTEADREEILPLVDLGIGGRRGREINGGRQMGKNKLLKTDGKESNARRYIFLPYITQKIQWNERRQEDT